MQVNLKNKSNSMRAKYYPNGSHIVGHLLFAMSVAPLFKLSGNSDATILELIGFELFAIGLIYLLIMPGCWDVYVEEDKVIFRNDWNVLWRNEWRFPLKEIIKIEIIKIDSAGPGIRIITHDKTERFYSLGYDRTDEFTQHMRQQGIKVESYRKTIKLA
ncbi:hypothetical protein Q0590_25500 [Rhodocytophaga aerolata]|uniref:PH domain-containing protein n=1 Tax=Rhodocytophaga aerolata TaxID=455078 RepID=A0ABT8RC28_9BACT|nr:hypothetical protein [Rhodocytophaga aerolata]MDO1449658.1 hypothetical protein [Rhodocytophaga aerolata]